MHVLINKKTLKITFQLSESVSKLSTLQQVDSQLLYGDWWSLRRSVLPTSRRKKQTNVSAQVLTATHFLLTALQVKFKSCKLFLRAIRPDPDPAAPWKGQTNYRPALRDGQQYLQFVINELKLQIMSFNTCQICSTKKKKSWRGNEWICGWNDWFIPSVQRFPRRHATQQLNCDTAVKISAVKHDGQVSQRCVSSSSHTLMSKNPPTAQSIDSAGHPSDDIKKKIPTVIKNVLAAVRENPLLYQQCGGLCDSI